MKHVITVAVLLLLTRLVVAAQAISGDYALKNVHTGKYVRIKDANSADGTPIVAYSPVEWKCVTWHFEPADAAGAYTLKNLFSGKTLVPVKGQAQPGTALEELPLTGQTIQQYELIAAGSGQYWIRLKGTQLYLSPADPKGATNSAIILQPKQTGDLQLWTLVEQHPTM